LNTDNDFAFLENNIVYYIFSLSLVRFLTK
jgi:hypothetical protein